MAMQIDTLFLMPDERPQTLMFVCPACERQSFLEATAQLEGMTCKNCGVAINGSKATIEGNPPAEVRAAEEVPRQ